ncbi:hypothetical protein, conserved [Leishmania lindenbergi]|uniref:Uncharacterized protein n=1 Tax=Leishmania lindenbergi TaxID=651832 RepID=A0AAW3A9A5_9TRYP
MRSWLLRCSPGLATAQVVPRAAYALCLHTPHRCIFVRELSTPVTLESSNRSVTPFPARLLWQFSSKRPRHLVLCVRKPLPAVVPLASEDAFEEWSDAEAAEALTTRTAAVDGAPRTPEDFMYGRLFLRPYNVAQLLTVLQGWSDLPAVVERPRSSLTLSAVPPASTSAKLAKRSSVDVRPREVMLTARLTRKMFSATLGGSGRATIAEAATHPSADSDPATEEDYPDSVYVDGDVCTLRVVLRDADLILFTVHLESVLSDLFAIEHYSRKLERCNTFDSQPSRVCHRTGARLSSFVRSSARPPQYLSHRYTPGSRAHGDTMEPRYRSHRPQRSNHGSSHHHNATTAAANTAATGPTESGEGPEDSNFFAATSAKAAPTTAANEAEDDDYKETLEDVEEAEDDEDDSEAAAETSDAAPPLTPAMAPSASAASSTSYVATHTRERGQMTMESTDRYAEGRFVRDGSVAASEVQEVSRVGAFDVLHRTWQAQGSTEKDDAQTTVHATATTGAFRSASGEVTGRFSYERLSTTTETTSAKTAAAAAAGTAIPLRRKAAEGAQEATATIDVTAIGSKSSAVVDGKKPCESKSYEHQKKKEEGAGTEAAKPTRKRHPSDSTTAPGKKKTAKRKSRKAPVKRKAPTSTATSVSASQGTAESADTTTF